MGWANSNVILRLLTHNTSGDTCLSCTNLPILSLTLLLSIFPGSVRQKSPRAKLCHVHSLLPPRQPANIFRLDCLTQPPTPRLNRLPPYPLYRQVETGSNVCPSLLDIHHTCFPCSSTKQCSRDNTALESSPSSWWHLLRLSRGTVWSSTCFNITSLICVNKSKANAA